MSTEMVRAETGEIVGDGSVKDRTGRRDRSSMGSIPAGVFKHIIY